MKFNFSLMVVFFLLCSSLSSVAEIGEGVIVSERFTDGAITRSSEKDLDWVISQNIESLRVITNQTPGQLHAELHLGAFAKGLYPTFAGLLADAAAVKEKEGSQLELSIEFMIPNDQAMLSELEFRAGLFGNAGTPAAKGNVENFQDDPGYYVVLPIKGGKGIIFKDFGKNGTIVGGSDKMQLRGAEGASVPPLAGEWHTLVVTIARYAQGLVINAKLDGSTLATGLDSVAQDDVMDDEQLIDTFHEIAFSTGKPRSGKLLIKSVTLRENPEKPVFAVNDFPGLTTSPPSNSRRIIMIAGIAGSTLVLIGFFFWRQKQVSK